MRNFTIVVLSVVGHAALAAQVPQYNAFGGGCVESLSVTQLIALDLPVVGATLRVELNNLPDNTAFMVTGRSRTSSALGALPLLLDPFGITSGYGYCYLWVSSDSGRFLAGAGNRATYTLAIPAAPVFLGYRFYQQALVFDSNASNPAHAVVSDAAEAVVGQSIPRMELIRPGTFTMGSSATTGLPYFSQANERPVHAVTISRPFWMGKYEVTQGEYLAMTSINPSHFINWPFSANHPVERVSWYDAMDYCAAYTASEAAAGRVPAGYAYRLPTEAEWEYCCRARTNTEYSGGNVVVCADANFEFSYHINSACSTNATSPVGNYAPNPWGLYDMMGNVFEWCLDDMGSYAAGTVVDPFAAQNPSTRAIRGGSWASYSSMLRSAGRHVATAGGSANYVGFRMVLAPILPVPLALDMPMAHINAGWFQMGSTLLGVAAEMPVHSVHVTRPFWMANTEITQEQYLAVTGVNPSHWVGVGRPVETVTFGEAVNFCVLLNARESAAGRLAPGYHYRLPTEAEWEYACRAGTTTEFNTGVSLTCAQAKFLSCGLSQSSVANTGALNAWNLRGMHGNVWEWCLDQWDGSANYPVGPVSDPLVTSGPRRVVRGGSYAEPSSNCRSASRSSRGPALRFYDVGFRIVFAPI